MHIDWILPHRLAAGPTPLDYADLQSLAQHGIQTVLTLTEGALWRFPDITPERVASIPLTLLHRGFPDQTAPSPHLAAHILADVLPALRAQQPLYVHCFGGIGRTGTVLHLILREAGLSLPATQALLRQRRPACLRLTPSQAHFVATWHSGQAAEDSVE
jgi:protein-tyrosine phosphatase